MGSNTDPTVGGSALRHAITGAVASVLTAAAVQWLGLDSATASTTVGAILLKLLGGAVAGGGLGAGIRKWLNSVL